MCPEEELFTVIHTYTYFPKTRACRTGHNLNMGDWTLPSFAVRDGTRAAVDLKY